MRDRNAWSGADRRLWVIEMSNRTFAPTLRRGTLDPYRTPEIATHLPESGHSALATDMGGFAMVRSATALTKNRTFVFRLDWGGKLTVCFGRSK